MPEKEQRGIGLPETNLSGEPLGQKQVEQPSSAVTAIPEVSQNKVAPIKPDAVDGKNFEAEEFVADMAVNPVKAKKTLWQQVRDWMTPDSVKIYEKRQESKEASKEG